MFFSQLNADLPHTTTAQGAVEESAVAGSADLLGIDSMKKEEADTTGTETTQSRLENCCQFFYPEKIHYKSFSGPMKRCLFGRKLTSV
jgi:hypothetical protein